LRERREALALAIQHSLFAVVFAFWGKGLRRTRNFTFVCFAFTGIASFAIPPKQYQQNSPFHHFCEYFIVDLILLYFVTEKSLEPFEPEKKYEK